MVTLTQACCIWEPASRSSFLVRHLFVLLQGNYNHFSEWSELGTMERGPIDSWQDCCLLNSKCVLSLDYKHARTNLALSLLRSHCFIQFNRRSGDISPASSIA